MVGRAPDRSALYVSSVVERSWILLRLVTWVFLVVGRSEAEDSIVMSQPVGGSVDSPSGEQPITWGLADASSDVGTIFRYIITEDAFSGDVKEYKVSEVGRSTLPSWLYYNASAHMIQGVAHEDDLSKQSVYLIQVEASLASGSSASDTFSIRLGGYSAVISDARRVLTEIKSVLPKPIYCPLGSSVTSASVIFHVNLQELSAKERVNILRLLGCHLGLSENSLRYVTVDGASMIDSSALVAGPGDVTAAPETTRATAVRWEVGCGSVIPPHMDILQVVESSAKDGSMHKMVSYGVIGWYVTNKKDVLVSAGNRMKRQARFRVMPTPTLQRTVSPPTSRPVPTRIVPPSSVVPEISPTPSRVVEPTRTTPTRPPPTISAPTPTRGIIQPSVPFIEPKSEPGKTTPLPTKPMWEGKSSEPGVKSTTPPSLPREPFQKKHDLTVGDIFNYAIPRDAFRSFNLNKFLIVNLVMAPGSRTLPSDSWISYDSIQHVLSGIPTNSDVGRHEYELVAYDQDTNRSETIPFDVNIRRLVTDSVTYETRITLDGDFDKFMDGSDSQMKVGSNIAAAYGDADASSISVLRVEKGSIIYRWTNKTVVRRSGSSGDCPVKEVNSLMDKVLSPGGKVEEPFLQAMKPYRVKEAGAEGRGVCEGVVEPRNGMVDESFYEKDPDPTGQPKTAQEDSSFGLIIAFVVVVAAIIVVLVIVIIWCSRKKNKTKKYSVEDSRNGNASKKGVPVILATDLDDRPLNGGSRSKPTVVRAHTGSSDTLSADSCDRKPMPPGYSSPAISRAEHSQPLLSQDGDRHPGDERASGQHSTFRPYPPR